MTKEQEVVDKLLSFAFAMSENMVGLTKGNYDENTFIKKTYEYLQKYTVDRNEQKIIRQALNCLEEIDTANHNEALECLECLYCEPEDYRSNDREKDYETIKDYILKTQEPKQYLKWEDLDFSEEIKILNVRMNNNDYILRYALDILGVECCFLYDSARNHHIDLTRQFFNDLHLEVVK